MCSRNHRTMILWFRTISNLTLLPMSVVVLGAGVLGLTTALQLQRQNYDVTVVAAFLPGDLSTTYTSPYAGANWHSFASKEDTRLQDLDKVGYHEFMKLADNPRSGVWRKLNALYYTQTALDQVSGDTSSFESWFDDLANTRVLAPNELRPGTVHGTVFDGVVISVPIYLNFLVQQCLETGVALKRVPAISNIDDTRLLHALGRKADLVVNCAGLMASRIEGVNDKHRNYPVRGQVVLVRNNISHVISVSGVPGFPKEMLYIFPRKEGGTIIGGCFDEGNWDTTEDKSMTQRILLRALQYAPELVDPKSGNPDHIDIVGVNVGLRPFRDGGMRIEVDSSKPWLIHNYGAGGGGYQGSFGFAAKVVELAAHIHKAKL